MTQEEILDLLMRAGRGVGGGLRQGLTLGFGDEAEDRGLSLFGGVHGAQEDAPVSFAVGEALGSIPYAALGGRAAPMIARMMRGVGPRTAAALGAGAIGSVHGALAGYGGAAGADRGGLLDAERFQDAAIGGALGGALGGLAIPGTRVGADIADNLPALMGRQMLEDGTVVRAGLGQGTRRSAPLMLELAGEGTPQERARAALAAAMAQDEGRAVRDTGRAVLGRFAGGGRSMTPFDAPEGARSVRALVDLGAQSDVGAARLNTMADGLISAATRRQVGMMRATGQRARARSEPLPVADRSDLLAAADDPAAHDSWMEQVRAMTAGQRRTLGSAMLARIRSEARTGSPSALRSRLQDTQMREKLELLGVRVPNLRGGRRAPIDDPDLEQSVTRLRGRTQAQEGRTRDFGNIDDRMVALSGRLRDEDALALLEESMRPQRAFYVRPGSDRRALRGVYEQGARFQPGTYLDATPQELEFATMASQPFAAFAHNVPYFFEDEPRPPAWPPSRGLIAMARERRS